MEDRIAELEKTVRALRLYSAILSLLLAAAVVTAFQSQSRDIVRAKGIVIVDDQGRERILIGAPLPAAGNRVRTDSARAMQVWGKRFPPEYAQWYQKYRHQMNGILVLDENGFDRVALGDSVPDPNIGRRIGPGTGLLINDEEGYERSGYSLIKVDSSYRVVLGLDSKQGTEAVSLAVIDDRRSGISIRSGDYNMFFGIGEAASNIAGDEQPFSGWVLRQGKEVKREVNIAKSPK